MARGLALLALAACAWAVRGISVPGRARHSNATAKRTSRRRTHRLARTEAAAPSGNRTRAEGQSLLARARHRGQSRKSRQILKIDAYVINLESRTDRCECMRKVLRNAPELVSVYRKPAEHGCDLKDSGHREGRPDQDQQAEDGLFCSNLHIWEEAAESDADFVVIFEDDAKLADNFWELVFEKTLCNAWDYIVLDTFRHPYETNGTLPASREGWGTPLDVCRGNNGELYPFHEKGWGTHVQIIKQAFLPRLIELARATGKGALDWWLKKVDLGFNNHFMWQAGIAWQGAGTIEGCASKIAESNVNNLKLHGRRAPRMKCPSPPP